MKNILCICLSPAVDATVRIPGWPAYDCVLKDVADSFAVGGKGLNVARWLARRGAKVACAGLLGADNALPFEREMAKYGIEDRFQRVPMATRVNEMFVSPAGGFKVNRPAFPGLTAESVGFDAAKLVGEGYDMVIASGSLPRDFPVDTYAKIVEAARAAGAQVVLDASGAALVEGAKAHPNVIKPNVEECAALTGFKPVTDDDFRRASQELWKFCDYPIISAGAAGCWFDGEHVAAPRVNPLDTTAAGDTLLAEWCYSGDPVIAVAAGSAACIMKGGEPPPLDLVEQLKGTIR